MKRLLLCTLLCSLTAFAKQNDSCFRAILATDTRAEGIEDSTVCDLDHMKKSLSAIAHHLHLKPWRVRNWPFSVVFSLRKNLLFSSTI